MTGPIPSFLKVPYELRPAKQVERRMLLETLETLAHLGFPIRDFQYTGLGSIYFIDFIMLHKVLGIKRLLSVERSEQARKRVKFNQPFRCVDVKLGKIGDFIPALGRRRSGHILWLDYDSVILREHLADVWLAAASLRRHSILIVTVDAEPPIENGTPRRWRNHFRNEAGPYLGSSVSVKDFAESQLVLRNRDVLLRAITSGLSSRDLEYIPLFNFSYADGHEMLTIGGMLGNDDDRDLLCRPKGPLRDFPYIRFSPRDEPFRINVPLLTRKERIHLDQAMPASGRWTLKQFELPEELVRAYKDIYRYLPVYAELVF